MRTPEIQIKRIEKPIAVAPASPKETLIKARGGEKMGGELKVAKPVTLGDLGKDGLVLSSLRVGKNIDAFTGHNTFCGTTTCCDNDRTRGDGSCPPTAC